MDRIDPDVLIHNILPQLQIDDLLNLCESDLLSICQQSDFWEAISEAKYPSLSLNKPSNMSWRHFYINIIPSGDINEIERYVRLDLYRRVRKHNQDPANFRKKQIVYIYDEDVYLGRSIEEALLKISNKDMMFMNTNLSEMLSEKMLKHPGLLFTDEVTDGLINYLFREGVVVPAKVY